MPNKHVNDDEGGGVESQTPVSECSLAFTGERKCTAETFQLNGVEVKKKLNSRVERLLGSKVDSSRSWQVAGMSDVDWFQVDGFFSSRSSGSSSEPPLKTISAVPLCQENGKER